MNTAGRSGGAAFLRDATIQGDRYLENTSGSNAGGLVGLGTMSITRSLFDANQSVYNGAYFQTGSVNPITATLNISNSLFSRNDAANDFGVDMSLNGVNATMLNNTHVDASPSGVWAAIGI